MIKYLIILGIIGIVIYYGISLPKIVMRLIKRKLKKTKQVREGLKVTPQETLRKDFRTSGSPERLGSELLYLLRRVLPDNRCTCGGNLVTLSTTSGDPEGIRKDKGCLKCNKLWGTTKAHIYEL